MTSEMLTITSTATLRPFGCELTTLSQADGSAIWKSGGTSVLASVHGPMAPRQASLEQPLAQISLIVAGRTSENIASDQEEWEPLLRTVLERCIQARQYPRCVIQIVCHILSNDGSVLSACLHAAVAALMDAGIAMSQLPTAVAIRVVSQDSGQIHLSLDPSTEQEQDLDRSPKAKSCALLCLVVAQSSRIISAAAGQEESSALSVLALHSVGGVTPLQVWPAAMNLAHRARPALTNFMKMAMQQKMETRRTREEAP